MNALPINDLPCTSPVNNTKQLFRKLIGNKPPNNKTYYITLYLHIHQSLQNGLYLILQRPVIPQTRLTGLTQNYPELQPHQKAKT